MVVDSLTVKISRKPGFEHVQKKLVDAISDRKRSHWGLI